MIVTGDRATSGLLPWICENWFIAKYNIGVIIVNLLSLRPDQQCRVLTQQKFGPQFPTVS